jgi:hypothetical protein
MLQTLPNPPPCVAGAHEAGHLAVALAIGAEPVTVRVHPHDEARVDCAWPGRYRCLDWAAFAVAGHVAEQLLGFGERMSVAELTGADGRLLAQEVSHGIDIGAALRRARDYLAGAPLAELADALTDRSVCDD